MIHSRSYFVSLLYGFFGFLLLDTANAAVQFTDWTTVNAQTSTATGALGTTLVTLSGNSVTGGVINGNGSYFAQAGVFTPPIALGDGIELTIAPSTASAFAFTFSQLVTNPVLHFFDLTSTLTFSNQTVVRISGNSLFQVSNSNVIGSSGFAGVGAGTIQVIGTFSQLSFTSPGAFFGDGFYIQIGVDPAASVPEPTTVLMLFIGFLLVQTAARRVAASCGQASQ